MRGIILALLLVVSAVAAAETSYLTWKSVRADRELCGFFDPANSSSKEPDLTVEPAMKMLKARFR